MTTLDLLLKNNKTEINGVPFKFPSQNVEILNLLLKNDKTEINGVPSQNVGILDQLLLSTDIMEPACFEFSVQNTVDIVRHLNLIQIRGIQKPHSTNECYSNVTAILAWILHHKASLKDAALCAKNVYEIWQDSHSKCKVGPIVKTLVAQIGPLKF